MAKDQNFKASIKDWWAENPMTYGKEHGDTTYLIDDERQSLELGSLDFFNQADAVFTSWNRSLHTATGPFGKIFDYKRYANKRVLEIGCGMGFMSMQWALRGAEIVATDLNPVAVAQTKNRFDLFNVKSQVLQTDAGNLPFHNESIGFIYSWGVLHHSPGIQSTLDRIFQLLEPGGSVGLMLYNRQSLRGCYLNDYVEGFLHLENEFLNPLELNSRYGDGAAQEGNPHTWPVTQREIRGQLMRRFADVRIKVLGSEMTRLLDLIIPGFGSYMLPLPLKKALARRWGWSIWVTGEKPA